MPSRRTETARDAVFALAYMAWALPVMHLAHNGGEPVTGWTLILISAPLFWLARHRPLDLAGLSLALAGVTLAGFDQYPLVFEGNPAGFIRHHRNLLIAMGGITPDGIRLILGVYLFGLGALTRSSTFRRDPAAWAYAGFLAVGAAGVPFSSLPVQGARLWLKLAYPFLVFLTLRDLADDPAKRDRVLIWLLLGAVFSLAMAAGFYAQGMGFEIRGYMIRWRGRGTGFLPHYEFYAGLCAMTFVVLFLRTRRRAHLVLAALAAFLTAASLTRVAIAGTLLSVGIAAAVLRRPRWSAGAGALLAGWVALSMSPWRPMTAPFAWNKHYAHREAIMGYYAAKGGMIEESDVEDRERIEPMYMIRARIGARVGPGYVFPPEEIERIEAVESLRKRGHTGGLSQRDRLGRLLWFLFKAHPAFGMGLGSAERYVPIILPGAHDPHLDFFRMLTETGYVGWLLFLGAFAALYRGIWKRHRAPDEALVALALGGLLFFNVMMLTENITKYYYWCGQLAWAFAGLALAAQAGEPKRRAASSKSSSVSILTESASSIT